MPRFAANLTMLFTELPFARRFEAAARVGFDAVEFLFPYDHPSDDIARWLHDNALANVLFNLPPGDWAAGERGIAALPGREDEFRASVDTALGYAAALGTPRLHVMAGIVAADVDRAACLAVYERNLRYAAARLADHGLTLLIEPINGGDMPGYLLQTQAEAHAIRERVGAPNLRVQMDLYHARITEREPLADLIRRHIEHIGHLQVAGVPGRHEPDHGPGDFDVRPLFALLDELGYDGWMGCEYRPRSGTEAGLQWWRDAVAASRFRSGR